MSYNDILDLRTLAHAQGITVEGTTALVNRTALEALFHNDQEN